jgi:hypothetical protein
VNDMNALCDTYETIGSRGGEARRRVGLELLRPFLERLAALSGDRAPAAIPSEDELRLTWFALGRGFDCM